MSKRYKDVDQANKISDFILTECRNRGEVLTNLKLQKLLYYAQSWYLADHYDSLFDEDFQAWVHGPVLPSQYIRFKHYEWRPILSDISTPNIGKKIENYLTSIVDFFGEDSCIKLERMTQNERPWKDARNGMDSDKCCHTTIEKKVMKNFYKNIL